MKFEIENLGAASILNPVLSSSEQKFTEDRRRLLVDPHEIDGEVNHPVKSFEIAGPREKIYFDPAKTTAVIVNCGGICPGLNAVIRALTLRLWHRYGVRKIMGVRYGYQGFSKEEFNNGTSLIPLDPEKVENIHEHGGTVLGTSRGTPPTSEIVDRLESLGADLLFTIGGDGTMRGAQEIWKEVKKRGKKISVIGIPKTIDNDIPFVRQSFGFETAVEIACQVVAAAHEEARGARNGIGLVKFMGRQSGYIAANAALATGRVTLCLVPEVPFALYGENGIIELLEKRLKTDGHAVIAVAEGAGQNFFKDEKIEYDRSGNARLKDIGTFLRDQISQNFRQRGLEFTLKYIDPSYIIRAAAPNSADRLFCAKLAGNAAHAAMAGKTGMLVGYWHGRVTHLPLQVLEGQRQAVNPLGELWFNVLESTGQPLDLGG